MSRLARLSRSFGNAIANRSPATARAISISTRENPEDFDR
jgi:hypothetical protein